MEQKKIEFNYNVAVAFQRDILNHTISLQAIFSEDAYRQRFISECIRLTKYLMHLAVDNNELLPQRLDLPKEFSTASVELTFQHLFGISASQVSVIPKVDSESNLCIIV